MSSIESKKENWKLEIKEGKKLINYQFSLMKQPLLIMDNK